jgi:hypothetical protein
MLTDIDQRSGGVRRTHRRSRRAGAAGRAAGLAALAAGLLLAAAPAGAQAPPGDAVFVHSAKSGKFSGGRLTLHGVSRHVTWSHHSGRAGVTRVKQLHRRLFSPGTPAATGTLHVAGHRGGDALTYKLSRPRHIHARRTVSYRAKPLGNGRFPSRAAAQAAAAARQFGAASLSIQGAQVTSTPTLQALNDVYGPGSNPHHHVCDGRARCWGSVIGTGLEPGSSVKVTIDDQYVQQYLSVDENGNLPTNDDGDGGPARLKLSYTCPGSAYGSVTSFQVDGWASDGSPLTARAVAACP